MGEFIRLFIVRKNRWASPKFLIGESYGTTRASGLAGYLADAHQIYLNGVILVSMTGLDVEAGPEVSYATTLPQQAATAWYHKQLAPELQAKTSRGVPAPRWRTSPWTRTSRPWSGVTSSTTPPGTRSHGEVARYTGLSDEYVLSANLRIDSGRFWKELLRDQRLTVGRLDSRYVGVDMDAAGETPDYDPAMADWDGPFGNAVNLYLRQELGYDPDLPYNIWGPVRPWNRDDGTNVGEMLRSAMQANPYMKVLVQGGYFDAATDYFSAVYTISHIQPGGEFKDRFRFAWYESGHMMYLRKPDLANSNDDLRDFMEWCMEANPEYPRMVRPRGGD